MTKIHGSKSRGMRWAARMVVLVAIVGGVLAAAAAVFASFTAGGAGAATATVGTLAAPSAVSTTSANGSGAVHVSWTGVTPAVGTLDGYYVRRHAGASATNACGSSPSSLLASTATSCDDTSVADGTYTYDVVAVFRSWTATSAAGAPVTVTGDAAAPSATITFPVDGSSYGASAWSNGCSPVGICGTASDTTGVQSVQVSVYSQTVGKYWNGTSFTSSTALRFTATLGAPNGTSTAWRLAMSRPADGVYKVYAYTTDTLGNTQAGAQYATVALGTVDTAAPTLSSINRTNPLAIVNGGPLSWTVTFNEPVTNVAPANFALTTSGITGTAPSVYLVTGSGTTWTVQVDTTGASGANNGAITLKLTSIGSITDLAGNALNATPPVSGQTYTYDTTSPAVTVNQTAAQADPTKTSPVSFTVSFNEAVSGFTASDVTIGGTAGGTKNVAVSGSSSPYTVTVSNLTTGTVTASINAGVVTDAAGNANTASTSTDNTITYDTTAPTVSVAIAPTTVTGTQGYLSASAQYYVYANVTDTASGAASATANVGNVTTNQTAVSLTAGTYSAFGNTYNYRSAALTAKSSLSSNTTYSVTATDAAGNTSSAVSGNVTVDNTLPSGSVTAPAGEAFLTSGSQAMTSSSADSGSGVASALFEIAPSGTSNWTTVGTDTTSPFSVTWDPSTFDDGRYDVRVTTADNAGNTVTSSVVNIEIEVGAPQPTAVQLVNGSGNSSGKIEQGDQIVVTFSEALKASSLCSGWSSDTSNQSLTSNNDVTVAVTDGGAGNDTLSVSASSCTLHFGTINLGATGYATTNLTFRGTGSNHSTLSWDHAAHTLTIVLGTRSGTVPSTAVSSANALYTPDANIQNHFGTAVAGTISTGTGKQF